MTPAHVILLSAQGAALALWAFFVFRCLFKLLAQARAGSGSAIPVPRGVAPVIATWWRDPASRGERWLLIALTALVLTLSVLAATTGPG